MIIISSDREDTFDLSAITTISSCINSGKLKCPTCILYYCVGMDIFSHNGHYHV